MVGAGDVARVEVLSLLKTPPTPEWVVGLVEGATSDSLRLRVGDSATAFASTGYGRLQLRLPRSSREGSARGLWMGALIGAGVVAVLATPISGGDENLPAGSLTGYGAVAGALLGAPIGAVIGAMKPGGRWVSARLPVPAERSGCWEECRVLEETRSMVWAH